MRIFNENIEEKKYRELLRLIKMTEFDSLFKKYLIDYVENIKNGKKINDFFDIDFLTNVILQLASFNKPDDIWMKDKFERLIDEIKFLLPQGTNTLGYESIKHEFIINNCNEKALNNDSIFNKEFYSLFESRNDYLQVMNIILSNENLIENFDEIVNFAVGISKEIDNQDLLKREIISFLHLYGDTLSSEEDYLKTRIDETRKRYGIYPGLDEKTLALISREVEKARGIIEKLENVEKIVKSYEKRIDTKTKNGTTAINETILKGKKEIQAYSDDAVTKMQNDLGIAKQELLEELNTYLISLESTMKSNSDKVLNQLLNDAREKIEQIRTIANSLSGTTTRELLKIQQQTQSSMEKLKSYVENNSELKESLKVATDSEEVMKALLEFNASQIELREAKKEIIIPEQKDFLIPDFKMTELILEPFDRKIKFKDRMKKVEEAISKLEDEGYIIPPALREALPWYMIGKKIPYFYGPTQSGKTTVAELLAKVVGTELVDGGKITEEHSITSYNNVNGEFDENALFYALYYGITVFYDEIDNGNPDNLVVLGTYSSKLFNKIDHPDRNITAQFAKRRFVPINVNARIIAAGNTSGKGRNREYVARSRFDESSLERFAPIYVGYSDEVEKKIFGDRKEWYDFFKQFRNSCNKWAETSSFDSAEGNLTTGDASTIVECINEEAMTLPMLLNGIFIQTKEDDYLAFLIKNIKSYYKIEEDDLESKISLINNIPLSELTNRQIAEMFIYESNKKMRDGKLLTKRR